MSPDGRQAQSAMEAANASLLLCSRDDIEFLPNSSPRRLRPVVYKLSPSPTRTHGYDSHIHKRLPRPGMHRNLSAGKQRSYTSILLRDISNVISRFRCWLRKRNHAATGNWVFLTSFILWFMVNVLIPEVKFIQTLFSQQTLQSYAQPSSSKFLGQHVYTGGRSANQYASKTKSGRFRGTALDQSRNFIYARMVELSPSPAERHSTSKAFSILARRVPVHEFERHDVEQYPADFSDNTQLYPIMDSSDIAIQETMELRDPYVQGECIPMKEWQTSFYPTCNFQHEFDLRDPETVLFGTNGYWRDAWRLEHPIFGADDVLENVVLKTLKYNHRFEDKYFEHNRMDAVAMERLTSSKHVMDIYSFCGNSVFMEFANGPKLSVLADKNKGAAKIRLARDIAQGIADVHSIDGGDCATLTHFDINLSNIGVINDTVKLNDFNIAVFRKWNTTSNEPCGFPSRYPNPQWRSPEEALNSQYLTEKIDVYSMGNIFFRLICKHEPWNKLEEGGKPSKEEINEKIQRGVLPVIPKSVLESTDFATVAIRKAMLAAYNVDPKKRSSARSIVNDLNEALKIAEADENGQNGDQ